MGQTTEPTHENGNIVMKISKEYLMKQKTNFIKEFIKEMEKF